MSFKFGLKTLAAAVALTCMSASMAQAEVLRVGTEATYAPFEFSGPDGKLTGFDVELIEAIGKEMGYEVQISNMPFDGLIPALNTAQIDVIAAAMSITPERAKRVAFSNPYYTSGLSILIREADKDKYKKSSDLKGQKLCVQIGSTGAINAESISPGHVKAFNTQPETFLELKNGGCAAVVNDRPINLYFLSRSAASGIVEMPEILTAEKYGIAVAKNNEKLLKVINDGLERIRANGEYAKIYKKWFKLDPSDKD